MVDMISYIGTALFVIVIFILLGLGKGDITSDIQDKSAIVTDDVVLLNMLRAPIQVENNNMTLSDLIVLWSFDKDKYENALEDNVNLLLKSAAFEYEENDKSFVKCYDFYIADKPIDVSGFGSDFKMLGYTGTRVISEGVSSTIVPVSFKDSVYVTLHNYKGGKQCLE